MNSAFIGRVVPNSGDRFNGAFQAGNGISDTLTDGNKFRISPRLGFAYDITGEAEVRRARRASASSTTGRRATRCST